MSAISKLEYNPSRWLTLVLVTMAFWLGGSLLLDFVIMPGMYVSGMMKEASFASTGAIVFSAFNHIEILCAAIALTVMMMLGKSLPEGFSSRIRTLTALSLVLFAIALLYTYSLTPQMSALGVNLNLFNSVETTPEGMNQLHFGYLSLESLKLFAAGTIFAWCYRNYSLWATPES